MGNIEILHQIKVVRDAIKQLESVVYAHAPRHEKDGGDEVYFKLSGLTETFIAGAAITAGQVVAITGDNEVSPADNTLRSQSVGVALNNAAVGEPVEVIIYGKAVVIADGAIAAGNPVAAATTPGRVVSLLSHSHSNPATSSVNLAHTHGFTPSGTIGTTNINHRHSFTPAGTISTEPNHEHKFLYVVGSAMWADPPYRHTYRDSDYTEVHVGRDVASILDLFTFAAGSHDHTFTGSSGYTGYANPAHSHAFTGSAGTTGSALGTHSHTQGNTGVVKNAQIVGKSLTAAGAGESIEILVCLAG